MANYLVKALYDKPSNPAIPTMDGDIKIKQEEVEPDQLAAPMRLHWLPTTTGDTNVPPRLKTETSPPPATSAGNVTGAAAEAKNNQTPVQQDATGQLMHPSRQLIVNSLGPLNEEPEPVAYRVTGANEEPLGMRKQPQPQRKRAKKAFRKGMAAVPRLTGLPSIPTARERSYQAVAPSAAVIERFDQQLQLANGNEVIAARDPRRRAQAGETLAASSSPGSFSLPLRDRSQDKQDEMAWEPTPEQHPSGLPAPANPSPSLSQQLRQLLGPDPPRGPAINDDRAIVDLLIKQLNSDHISDLECRVMKLEEENLNLRESVFRNDREIRKLKAELLGIGGRTTASSDTAVEVGTKRLRLDEDVGGAVKEP